MNKITAIAVFLVPSIALGVPIQYTHQGRLIRADGIPVEDDVEISFRLMDDATEGATVWEETLTVSLNNGFYSTVLGADEETNPLDIEVLDAWPTFTCLHVNPLTSACSCASGWSAHLVHSSTGSTAQYLYLCSK